jgi:hypothetical protein
MVIANLLGIFFFLYLVWKKLKEDYTPEKIFSLCFTAIFALLVGVIVSKNFLPEFWFWIEALFVSISFAVAIKRQKIKSFEGFGALAIGFMPWLSLYFLAVSIKNSSLSSFLAFWISLFCVALFFFLNSQYRKFTWYKSGRVGFSEVVTVIVFLILRAILLRNNIFELYLSGTVVFLLFLVLLHLNKNEN